MTDSFHLVPQAGARLATAFFVAALALASPVRAADTAPGLRVVKDPVTGALRAPTSGEAAALDATAASRRRAPRGLLTGKVGPAPIHHPDGTVEQELDESSLTYMVATRNADGTTSVACVTGDDGATTAPKRSQPAKKAAKEASHDR